jgi:hypothetical protein
VPRTALPLALIVSDDDPGVLTGFRLNVALAPPGMPVIDSETLPVKPPIDVTATA